MKSRCGRSVIVAFLIIGVFATFGFAEEKPGGDEPLYRWVHLDQVDPSRSEDFEAAGKAWVDAFRKAGMDEEWSWWAFEGVFEYLTSYSFSNWAELDQEEEREKKMVAAIGKDKLETLRKPTGSVLKHHNFVVKMVPELSYHPETGTESAGKYFAITTHWVRPGKEEQFKELTKKVMEAYVKTGQPRAYTAWEVVVGEGTYMFTSMAKDASDYYAGDDTRAVLVQAYGEESANAMYKEYRDCVIDWEMNSYNLRTDLSYRPGTEEAKTASK
jgi:hypothetical protein